jgi:DNA invertase Pin-like site-specific DNA recombinase
MTNVGDDKDTHPRQLAAVKKYARTENIEIVKEFYDEGVSGTVRLMDRQKFADLVKYASDNSIDTILVESADRFSRDAMIGLMGHDELKKIGITLIPVDAPAHYLEDTPTNKLIRLLLVGLSQFVKESLVEKMSAARGRKREKNGRCEGRIPAPQEAVELAKKLRDEGLSYREIGERLSDVGFRVIQKNKKTKTAEVTDRIYKPASVKNMIENL